MDSLSGNSSNLENTLNKHGKMIVIKLKNTPKSKEKSGKGAAKSGSALPVQATDQYIMCIFMGFRSDWLMLISTILKEMIFFSISKTYKAISLCSGKKSSFSYIQNAESF